MVKHIFASFIALDYWEHFLCMVSERPVNLQDMNNCNLLEVGAAGLLVGDMEAKMKGQHWKYFGTTEMPYLEQLLQPASVTMITNSASARSHLRAITASKRTRAGPQQIWYVFYCGFSEVICKVMA